MIDQAFGLLSDKVAVVTGAAWASGGASPSGSRPKARS
jgi:hypothetical protein